MGGRIADVPSIWSNCLAGWILSGGGGVGAFLIFCAGVTSLYFGGILLNDACDERFDALTHPRRPIPSGTINLQVVWLLSLFLMSTGALALVPLGKDTAILAVLLIGAIVLFNLLHRAVAYGYLLIIPCRFLLFLSAGSVAADGISGLTIWSALALSSYAFAQLIIVNTKYRYTNFYLGMLPLFAVPLLLAWIANGPGYQLSAALAGFCYLFWLGCCLFPFFLSSSHNRWITSNHFQAGYVVLDFLLVGGTTLYLLIFLLLFFCVILLYLIFPRF